MALLVFFFCFSSRRKAGRHLPPAQASESVATMYVHVQTEVEIVRQEMEILAVQAVSVIVAMSTADM